MSQFTKAEVAQHKDDKSMFIIIDDGVYEVASTCTSQAGRHAHAGYGDGCCCGNKKASEC